jgi:hypothetical protein
MIFIASVTSYLYSYFISYLISYCLTTSGLDTEAEGADFTSFSVLGLVYIMDWLNYLIASALLGMSVARLVGSNYSLML